MSWMQQPEVNDETYGIPLLGDNIRESLELILQGKVRSQLDELEARINDKIDAFRCARADPVADIAAIETAIEELMEKFRKGKEEMYAKVVREHGERQAAKVFKKLGVQDRLPKAYVDFLHETWDVVGDAEASHMREGLDEEPVIVSSIV